MPFGGHPLQFALVFVLAVALCIRGWQRNRVVTACGRFSFIIAAAWMLFGKGKRWYPPGLSILATVTWVLSGCALGFIVSAIAARLKRRVPAKDAVAEQGSDVST